MHVAVAAFFVTIVNLVLVLDADASDCKYPAPVEKFAASYYMAQIMTNDPNIVKSVALYGGEAAMVMYRELKNVLEEHRQCNADEAAYTGSHYLASVDNFTLTTYFKSVAYCIGLALYKFRLLDCNNAVSRSLEYFKYTNLYFQGQDKNQLGSYFHGAIYAWVNYFLSLRLKLEDFAMASTSIYSEAVNEELNEIGVSTTKKCKFDTSSD